MTDRLKDIKSSNERDYTDPHLGCDVLQMRMDIKWLIERVEHLHSENAVCIADLDDRHHRIIKILDDRIAELTSIPANTALRLLRIQIVRELGL